MTDDDRPRCPKCKSLDTVSYWDIKCEQSEFARSLNVIYQQYYPNARKCVDCENVWW